ncbi:hypothetical protein [uncultured Sulfitobacter sp.]|uniref:hypothetical protein n=1 Tax=uncultured Sulfitobacter sp. TaxID=191468 RepID=UPI00260329BD|nr:hypothetical protein [uncultured Sulfitobacter sp.]
MSEPKPLYLHLGAHRTGTSSFQMMLAENGDLLRGAGFDLAYPGRDDIPGGDLALRLPQPRNKDQWQDRFVPNAAIELRKQASADSTAMILSEENIPGRMIHFGSGRFYPAAEERFKTLAEAAAAPVLRALLVVREYADLYVSAYRKRAEDNHSDPFDDDRRNMMRMDRGWPELVALIQTHLQAQQLIVVEYASRGRSVDLLRHLLPETREMPLIEPAHRMNHSPTDAALEVLQAIYAKGDTLEREAWQQIILEHRDDHASRGISEFTKRQNRILRGRYAEDLDRLAQMPGVVLVR